MSYTYDNMVTILYSRLRQLEFNDYEARIYEVLLLNSPASATLIAKKCNLSRSSVYTTLSSLISKGLVSTTLKNNVKQFIAEDTSSIENILKQEEKKLKTKLEAMNSLANLLEQTRVDDLQIPGIKFFEGQDGLKRIYLSMLRDAPENSTLYLMRDEFIWQSEWHFVFEPEWHARVKRLRIEKNITTKLLVNDSPEERAHHNYYRSREGLAFRTLPHEKSLDRYALYILGDTVSILSMETNNLIGIQITNRHIAKNFENLFALSWAQSQ